MDREPTAEELAAAERADIIARCLEEGTTKGLSEEERAKVANEPEFRKVFDAERQEAKAAMLKRNEQRIKQLGKKLKDGETLEEYDTRVAKEEK